jgi:hypothetical protein
MKYLKYLPAVALLSIAACASTTEEEVSAAVDDVAVVEEKAALDRPSFSASQSTTISAVVEAIDHDTRVVTMRTADGEEVTFTAGEEVRNLGQVQVGDVLVAEYVESVSIEVMPDDGMGSDAVMATAVARAEEGEMPGFAAMDTAVVIATVEEINLEENTFKLKGPDGLVEEFVAVNPDNLRRAEVGDLVVTTITESVAIMVEHQPAD